MAFAAAEQGHHDVPQAGLCHQEQRVVSSTACLQSRVSAAALGSAELHARIACMAWRHRSCCQANDGRSWPSSQRSFALFTKALSAPKFFAFRNTARFS